MNLAKLIEKGSLKDVPKTLKTLVKKYRNVEVVVFEGTTIGIEIDNKLWASENPNLFLHLDKKTNIERRRAGKKPIAIRRIKRLNDVNIWSYLHNACNM